MTHERSEIEQSSKWPVTWADVGCPCDTHQCCEHWGGCPTNSHALGRDGTARLWFGSEERMMMTWRNDRDDA